MSGYKDFSKSNNAVAAEAKGRFPASTIGKRLGVPSSFVADLCQFASGGEWHHTSGWFNTTSYYAEAAIAAWMAGDHENEEWSIPVTPFAEALSDWKSKKSGAEVKIVTDVEVRWIEWSGPLNHPKATKRQEAGCTVTDRGGKFVEVTTASGLKFKKGRATTGFEVRHSDGKQVWL